MRIEHLQFLLEVARTKSISVAAQKLYISQTGLSTIINSVEQELNIQIFKRTNKGTILTPAGEQALKLMEEIVAKNDELHYLYSSASFQSPVINLGVFPSAVHAVSSHLTPLWASRHKNARLHIYEVGSEDVHSYISSHTANIIIGAETTEYFDPKQASKDGKTHIETLAHDHFCLLVSSQSPLAVYDRVPLSDCLGYHLLLTHNFPDHQEKSIGHVLRQFHYFTVLSNLEIAKSILWNHPNMVMIVPSLSVYQDERLDSGQLKLIELTGFETDLTVFLTYDLCSSLSIQENLLIQEIHTFFESIGDR